MKLKKNENLLVLGMYSLIIAFVLEMASSNSPVANIIVLLFLGLAIYSNARYVILTSLEKKKV
ncbi:MAG: hypothetical protein KGD58_10830 [Candidatus Lokiarchaeota archaeon]|nr:hypothetical protein [Candidatus Lokiarchaeota archaeon]